MPNPFEYPVLDPADPKDKQPPIGHLLADRLDFERAGVTSIPLEYPARQPDLHLTRGHHRMTSRLHPRSLLRHQAIPQLAVAMPGLPRRSAQPPRPTFWFE